MKPPIFTPDALAMILNPSHDNLSGVIYSEPDKNWKWPETSWLQRRLKQLREERGKETE